MSLGGLLRAMAYRLVRSRASMVLLCALATFVVGGVVSLKVIGADGSVAARISETSSDISLGLGALFPGTGCVDLVRACGVLFVRGSAVSMIVSSLCGLFFASDLKCGFVKNVAQGRGARTHYALAACGLALAVSALAVLGGVVASLVSLVSLGFVVSVPGIPELLSWVVEVWLSVSAYALAATLAAILSGSEAFSVVFGLSLGGGVVGKLLCSAAGLLAGSPESAGAVFSGSLATVVSRLGSGSVLPWGAMGPVLVAIAFTAALTVVTVRRRGLA
ncbi:hypothetical protein [Olsenella sp. DNF00959]|uniref:hypothetical protein n=1 Tax=Olsenella sp. DNF00959 TaxID=1476999 RepID=UPI000781AB09|nr:hypothetical protein [Olsenella sp. DNF00959]KXB63293.1 hypothetical protein HMPREF1868_00827 [Olsenella sp. DNF00959]